MDKYEQLANTIIDEVCDVFLELYPDIPVKQEFLDETPDAHHIYGTAYYDLESSIADKIKKFGRKKHES